MHSYIKIPDGSSIINTYNTFNLNRKEYKWSIKEIILREKNMKNEENKIKERKWIAIIFQIFYLYKFYLPGEEFKVSNNFLFYLHDHQYRGEK